ncbi:unnamed protein product [Amaranthus hypochondriacus]
MYENQTEEDVCFDPNNIPEQPAAPPISTVNGNGPSNHNNGFSSHDTDPQIHMNNHHYQQPQESDSSVEFQNPNNLINTNSWVNPTNLNHMTQNQDMGYTHFDENLQPTTDLLTLLHLPRCSFASSSLPQTQSLSFGKPSSSPPPGSALGFLGELNPAMMVDNPSENGSSTIFYDPTNVPGLSYDPLFHLNLPPQPSPSLRDLMFVPHGYGNGRGNDGNGNGSGNGNGNSLFGGLDEGNTMNGIGGIYQDNGDHLIHGNGVFEFSKGDGKGGKCPKNFVTERQRRQNFNDKYQLLRSLVPNQTKGDRASIVWDAINHINELRRTVGELKLLVEKKRMSRERIKRHKTDQDTPSGGGDQPGNGADTVVKPDPDEEFNGSTAIQLRSSWIQRKCKDTEVDVRIVDDDVTIKLVQRKKINCLLSVSRTLDDLQLDLRHVAGGHVGDYYSYLFNSKICEGSSVYASAIANKLIEIVEKQYAAASVAVAPTTSF